MKIFIFLILCTSPFLALAETVEDLINNNSIPSFCYKKNKCSSTSIATLKKYEKGKKLQLNFSERMYYGICYTYNIAITPFGASVGIYIKKVNEKDYIAKMFFGWIPEKKTQQSNLFAEYKPRVMKEISNKYNANDILKQSENLSYMFKPAAHTSFFAKLRESKQGMNLQTYGFFAGGIFICDAKLLHQIP